MLREFIHSVSCNRPTSRLLRSRRQSPPLGPMAVIATCLVFASGCGSSRDVEIVPVHGTVTFNGGAMPGEGRIFFVPMEPAAGFPRRPGNAHFGPDGTFKAKTFEPGDGLIPGRYGVVVQCWKVPPDLGGPPAESYLAAKYMNSDTSGLTLDVAADEPRTISVTFDVSDNNSQ